VRARTAARFARATFTVIVCSFAGAVVLAILSGWGDRGADWSVSGLQAVAFTLTLLSFPVAGVLIASRRPANPIGWILLAIGFVWGVIALLDGYVQYGLVADPGALPREDLALALDNWTWIPATGLMGTFLILLFPEGRLPGPGWRPWARLSAFVIVAASIAVMVTPTSFADSGFPRIDNPLGIAALRPVAGAGWALVALLPVCIAGSAWSLIQRFRRSQGRQRLQLKWLAAGAGATAGAYLVAMAAAIPFGLAGMPSPSWVRVTQLVALHSFVLIPIAVGIAILKHRLYDIDVIVNRALVYGALTAILGLCYAAIVATISSVVGRSDLTIAAATLAVAALFQPLRLRLQSTIDRRFYRRKYDAARTLDAFGARLRAHVDLESLSQELVAVVHHTMQPAHVSLWLREQRGQAP
jgi:hypothetical protein